MRAILLAGVLAFALAPYAFGQTFDSSLANGKTSATEASTSNVTGTGSNMSGGMIDSFNTANDLSMSQLGPHGVAATTTNGSDESQIAGMTFDVGTGSDTGTASAAATSSGAFKGFSFAATPHHHH